ncbi:MAG: helix-turn-helix transcriptional regulator [Betaproteobacteria bacterium]|nr:helix-turn-helix transcriptional regulator [Betaproteobacteria bacterium]
MEEYDGKKLRLIRIKMGVTQFQLAIMLGLYPSQVSRIESNKKKFSKVLALAVASVMGVDIATLRKLNTSQLCFCPHPADCDCVDGKSINGGV